MLYDVGAAGLNRSVDRNSGKGSRPKGASWRQSLVLLSLILLSRCCVPVVAVVSLLILTSCAIDLPITLTS